jgi:ribose 5-phosphate isomerase A
VGLISVKVGYKRFLLSLDFVLGAFIPYVAIYVEMWMDPRVSARRNASIYVADTLQECVGCVVAMGSGSTVKVFIDELSRRGVVDRYYYVSTSLDTTIYLRRAGARHIETGLCPEYVDIYIDSADEIDRDLNLLKGGGGALFREKIAMLSSRRRIIIVDETKLVDRLGSMRDVPIEVEVFALNYVLRALSMIGYRGFYREAREKLGPIISDNGNIIVDVKTGPIEDPGELDRKLRSIDGVVATGIFTYMGYEVVVGGLDGGVSVLKKSSGNRVVST